VPTLCASRIALLPGVRGNKTDLYSTKDWAGARSIFAGTQPSSSLSFSQKRFKTVRTKLPAQGRELSIDQIGDAIDAATAKLCC
jgi:hypothetical protein